MSLLQKSGLEPKIQRISDAQQSIIVLSELLEHDASYAGSTEGERITAIQRIGVIGAIRRLALFAEDDFNDLLNKVEMLEGDSK